MIEWPSCSNPNKESADCEGSIVVQKAAYQSKDSLYGQGQNQSWLTPISEKKIDPKLNYFAHLKR